MISLVLSGGVGSRLWPVSRETVPKPFSDFFEQSLFEMTVKRLAPLGEVQVCTGEKLRGITQRFIREKKLPIEHCFFEPVGRNTAPAIALACWWHINHGGGQSVMGVFPSDHWIGDQEEFSQVIKLAERCALEGKIVTLGLKPTYPATGFGYIEYSDCELDKSQTHKAFEVKGFREKPSKEVATDFLKKGNFVWNSGMFIFKIEIMAQAFEKFMPELWSGVKKIDPNLSNINDVFPSLPSESIDYGVMEKAKNQVNIPCSLGWSDLGSWDDVANIANRASSTSHSSSFHNKSESCYGYSSSNKTLAFSNVDDLIVVDTSDAILVTKKGSSQDVKNLYDMIKNKTPQVVQHASFEHRPWGRYDNIYEEDDFKAKVIHVDPGQQLSYQSHEKRSEVWVIVRGVGEVVLDDQVQPIKKGSVIQIPFETKHRIRNIGHTPLVFVEVQTGEYFGEDDIVRYADDYKRK